MLKLRVKQVIWVKNIKNIQHKKAKAARFLSILKIYVFCWKIQQRISGTRESTTGVMQYLSLRIHQKLSGSSMGAVGA